MAELERRANTPTPTPCPPRLPTLAGGSARTLRRVSLLILGEDRFQGENLDRTLVCPLGISFLL